LSVELQCQAAAKDVHSASAPLVPNPVWRLVWALNALKNEKEKVLIEGFYDNVETPSREEIKCLKSIPFEEEEAEDKKELGLKTYLHNLSGKKALQALLFQPTCTINGFLAGYTGAGSKTVLPSKAVAKLDFRLVPNQTPNEIVEKLKKHLKKHGFRDIKVIMHGSTAPTRTSITDKFVQTVVKSAEKVYNKKVVVYPTSAGSGPMHLFRNILRFPVVSAGCSHPEANGHAPNENLRIDSFVQGTKFMATIMQNFSTS
jgi:acetylornithine deacetylase/succinyl-diaminopimelate desuccinylase-like protein